MGAFPGRNGYLTLNQNEETGLENRHYGGWKASLGLHFTQHCYSSSGKIKMTRIYHLQIKTSKNQYCSYLSTHTSIQQCLPLWKWRKQLN